MMTRKVTFAAIFIIAIAVGQAYAVPMERFAEAVKIDNSKIFDQRFDKYDDFNIVVVDWQGNEANIQIGEHGDGGTFDLVSATRDNPARIAFEQDGDRRYNWIDRGAKEAYGRIALTITPMGPILNIKATVDRETYEINATAEEYNLDNGVVSYNEDILSQARILVNVTGSSVVVCQHGDPGHYHAIAAVNLEKL